MKFEQRSIEKNVNVPSHNQMEEFIRLSLWLLVIVLGSYFVLGLAAEKIAERLPAKFEKAIASAVISKFDQNHFPQTQEYLQKILDRLVASDKNLPDFSYKIFILDDKIVNAIALPAGNILIFNGLLAEFKNENQIAMVLAHELGHYAHRDHLRGLGRGVVLMSIAAVLGLSGDAPGFIVPSIQTFDLKFSRVQEAAADSFGIDLLASAYGHVGGALEIFNILKLQKKGSQGPEFFSSHPDTIWRIQSLNNHIQLNKYTEQKTLPFSGSEILPFPEEKEDQKNEDVQKLAPK
ncbi:MAG: M48 family metallopeptidase [Candidatus Omnitrophica bacterium]|nr:M48 family metallopeptidase [Candidatus Omnitrophota bacterium]